MSIGGPAWQAVLSLARRAAARPWPVLVVGETGTGKELVAREIHHASKRAGALVPVNCGAIPHTMVEHALFGHVRGAYTGAVSDSLGYIREAHGGTLFLDELGELPLDAQVKLLRVLQERTVRPVGAASEKPVDFRLVAATHRDVEAMAHADPPTFREDLWHRLRTCVIRIPPLRERPDDIEPLARHFLANDRAPSDPKDFEPAALAALRAHRWPGNVRELEATVRRALTHHEGRGALTVDDLGLAQAEPPAREDRPGKRSAALQKLSAGVSQRAVAREFGVDEKSIRNWRKSAEGSAPGPHKPEPN